MNEEEKEQVRNRRRVVYEEYRVEEAKLSLVQEENRTEQYRLSIAVETSFQ